MISTTARWIRAAGLDALELRLQVPPAAWLWVILSMALIVRIVVAALFTDFDPATASIWEYGIIARATIEHGHGHMVAPIGMELMHPADPAFIFPTAYEPPGLVWIWIGLFRLFGTTTSALATMTALDVVAAVGVVYYSIRVARALFGSEVIGLLAGVIMALHPVFAFSVATYHCINIYLLLLLIVFDLTLSTRRQTYSKSILVGAIAGIAALIRVELLVLAGAIILGSLLTHRQWKMTAVVAFAAFVVIAPWTLRNYVVFHRFMPVVSNSGELLFWGFNPEANGSGKWGDDQHLGERLLGPELRALPLSRDYESARDKVFRSAAIDYMKWHPVRSFAVLPIYKVSLFWFYDIYERKTHKPLFQLQFWPLFVFSIIGLVMAARSGYFARPDHRTVLLLFAFETLVMTCYAVHARFRMNVEPFLYAYAAVGAVGLWGWVRRRLRIAGPAGSPGAGGQPP